MPNANLLGSILDWPLLWLRSFLGRIEHKIRKDNELAQARLLWYQESLRQDTEWAIENAARQQFAYFLTTHQGWSWKIHNEGDMLILELYNTDENLVLPQRLIGTGHSFGAAVRSALG